MRNEKPISQLFVLRVWYEGQVDGQDQWRCRLQHVPSDTVCYFRSWETFIPTLERLMHDALTSHHLTEKEK